MKWHFSMLLKFSFLCMKRKKVFCPKLFFYTCEMVLPFWTFFASSNESVSCLAVCWVVHSSKREEILFINHKIKFLEISRIKVKRWWDKGVSEANLVTPYEVLLRLNRHTKRVGKTCKIYLYICIKRRIHCYENNPTHPTVWSKLPIVGTNIPK